MRTRKQHPPGPGPRPLPDLGPGSLGAWSSTTSLPGKRKEMLSSDSCPSRQSRPQALRADLSACSPKLLPHRRLKLRALEWARTALPPTVCACCCSHTHRIRVQRRDPETQVAFPKCCASTANPTNCGLTAFEEKLSPTGYTHLFLLSGFPKQHLITSPHTG